jgi:hypothetical protein
MGEGGCAFLSKSGRLLHPPLRLECVFEWKGLAAPVSVSADLLYSFVNTKTHEEAAYYGVEFIQEDRHLILPIVRELEQIYESNPQKVQLDLPPA